MDEQVAQTATSSVGWRLKVGGAMFVLGGDFWDKLHSLFVCDAQAVFPDRMHDGWEQARPVRVKAL